jgi:DNA-directed RNA polymerase specialized sigma24 family protein
MTELMTLDEALKSVDMDDVIDRMTAYTINYFKKTGIKQLNGLEPDDFVAEILMKVAADIRDWEKAKCSFTKFLFGSLRSSLYSFNKGFKKRFVDDEPEASEIDEDFDLEDQKKKAIEQLQELGADDNEIGLFECWLDDMYKPADIAEQLKVNVDVIHAAKKRLVRKLPKLRTKMPDTV